MELSDWLKVAGKTKQDVLGVLAREWRSFLEAVLADSTLEVNAQIRLIPSDKKNGLEVKVVSQETKIHKNKKKAS